MFRRFQLAFCLNLYRTIIGPDRNASWNQRNGYMTLTCLYSVEPYIMQFYRRSVAHLLEKKTKIVYWDIFIM